MAKISPERKKELLEKLTVFAHYASFAAGFAVVFALMLAMLFVCAVGIPFGLMLSAAGAAAGIFHSDVIVSHLAPEFMLFCGLAAAFAAAAVGLLAVKLGILISKIFIKIKHKCDKIRGWETI